jgi:hypothetical protein
MPSPPKTVLLFLFALVLRPCAANAQQSVPSDNPQSQAAAANPSSNSNLQIPAGTKIILALTGPVWAKSAHIGDPIYAVSAFPVSINNLMAIPPGTYVEGQIDYIVRPTRKTNRAEFQMHFTKLIFANGYTADLPVSTSNQQIASTAKDPYLPPEVPAVNAAATASVHVDIYFTSDVLLDNGSQIEMLLQSPLTLDSVSVAAAARQSKAPQLQWSSSTRCRPTPGTPGTPGTSDTVIPGSPGTPATVIPGGPGMPDTVIPGTPATPATVIPGTPGTAGTPGTYCPGPPSVISETGDAHKESFKVGKEGVHLAGQFLPKGSYQATWNGPGPDAQIQILQKGKVIATVNARVANLLDVSPQSRVDTASDGSLSVLAIQFKGKTFALTFDSVSQQHITQASAKAP